jgi:hypothetical protein
MPSQLYTNDGITFLAAKNFTYRGEPYEIGEDFPQEEANNIETMVRARFVIPVLEEDALRPRHWHGHIRTREQAEEYLNRTRVQLKMPEPYDEHDEQVNLDVLTHPETTPEPTLEASATSGEGEADLEPEDPAEPTFDPSDHTVTEVKAYLAGNPGDEERVLALEADGRARKGLLEE